MLEQAEHPVGQAVQVLVEVSGKKVARQVWWQRLSALRKNPEEQKEHCAESGQVSQLEEH